ncbi:MAG: tetratricopeptide repeat protein [Spirochaetia bacterium]|nr:tetratricopeptide repeat protein [Spirochaetia bacterium]
MRKGLIVLTLVLAFAASAFSAVPSGFGIEIRVGSIMLNPSAFNTAFQTSLSDVFDFPADVATEVNAGTPIVDGFWGTYELGLKYFVTPNISLHARLEFTPVEVVSTVRIDGVDSFEARAAFETMFIGVGGRYYITNDSGFCPYFGADAGMFMNVNSYYQIWANAADPVTLAYLYSQTNDVNLLSTLSSQVADYKDGFFGANLEAGFEYMFSDSVGLGVGIGYRLATMKLAGDFVDVNGATVVSATEANLGGVYGMAGLNFYFGGKGAEKRPKAGAAASTGTGAGAKYEKYGDYYFKQKNYKAALKYYGGAMKLDKTNAVLYKKVGLCYYYMKDMTKAKQYMGYYLKLNPNDTQMKKWLGM